MNYQQIVDTQISLMEQLLKEQQESNVLARQTNALLTDILVETLDSNSMIEDTLMEVLGLSDELDLFDDEDDFDDFDDEDDLFEDEYEKYLFDDEDDEDEIDDSCGDPHCPVCGEVEEVEEEIEEELSIEEIEALAYADLVRITSEKQLPYTWYGQEYHEYVPNRANPVAFLVLPEARRVIAMLKDTTGKVVRRGVAKCMPEDTFSINIGAVIALHRLFKLEIPEVYTK